MFDKLKFIIEKPGEIMRDFGRQNMTSNVVPALK